MTEEVKLKLFEVPAMNYLYLSLSQARYLLKELNQSLKEANGADILVVPFPNEAKND